MAPVIRKLKTWRAVNNLSQSDPETQEFVRIVSERADRTAGNLEKQLKKALVAGSFVAHGGHRPVSELDADLAEASKLFLADAAAKVFDRYAEAPVQVDSSVPEKFLKTPLDRVTSAEDPLQIVTHAGGRAQISDTTQRRWGLRDPTRPAHVHQSLSVSAGSL